jgi:hypothetical protein
MIFRARVRPRLWTGQAANEDETNYKCLVQKNYMQKVNFNIEYEVYPSIDDLSEEDMELLAAAREFTKNAYAPYSNFYVSAVAKLVDGNIVKGTNQENASSPVGTCAERILLGNAAILFPGVSLLILLPLVTIIKTGTVQKLFLPAACAGNL